MQISNKLSRLVQIVGLAAILLVSTDAARAQLAPLPKAHELADKLLVLGTGPAGGAFRPIGEALCDTVNADRNKTLVRCVPAGTAGSAFNLQAVEDGAMQIGMAQEDLFVQKYRNIPANASPLRAVAVLHASPIAVMVRKGAGIADMSQLAGKVVNLGNRGSGQFAVTASLLRALRLRTEDLAGVTYAATSEFESLFCSGKVDVVVEAVAHPSELFRKLMACGGQFLDFPESVMTRMQNDNPFLRPMDIPPHAYAGQMLPVRALGMRNVLFTHVGVHEESVFRLTRSLAARMNTMKEAEVLLMSVPPVNLANAGSVAVPLHPGAQRAYKGAQP